MRVLAWVVLWTLLLVGSAWYLWQRLRRLGRATRRLAAELSAAEQALTRIQQEAAGAARRQTEQHAATNPAHAPKGAHLAVFTGIPQAVAERRAVRRALDESKRARRAANLPGWARRVDSDVTAPRKASP